MDPKQITLSELRAEIERLDAAATKGPWRVENGGEFIVCRKNGISFDVATIPDCLRMGANANSDEDGPFIAFSRTALPELLRRLVVAEAALENTIDALRYFEGGEFWEQSHAADLAQAKQALAEIRGNAEAEPQGGK